MNSVYSNSNIFMGSFERKGKRSYLDGLRRESTLFEDFVEPCKTKKIIMQHMHIIYNPLTRVIQIQIERHTFTVAMVMENISGSDANLKIILGSTNTSPILIYEFKASTWHI